MVAPLHDARGEKDAREVAARLARGLRERIDLERSFGWEVPLTWPIPPGTSLSPGPLTRAQAPPPGETRRDRPGVPQEEERERRRALLQPIDEAVRACVTCALCRGRTNTVFGVGDPCARLMFVGEGPGEDEDRQGEPFVGKAGQLLNRMIRAMGLSRGDVYIANIVKCRPPGNRNPTPLEVVSCFPYLRQQVEIISPAVICALGNVATRTLLDTQAPIGRLRGRFADYRGIPVMPTFHPSYLLRNPEDKRLVWEDLQKVMERLGLPCPSVRKE